MNTRFFRISGFAVASILFATTVLGNPFGGVVAHGNANIFGAGNLLTINQNSTRSIIDWGSFNIGNGETTVFQFNAGAHSAVLNRVNVGNPSTIAGMLRSTLGPGGPVGGTVLILNPSGILFTSSAQVNVGSLVASTLNLGNENEFLQNGKLTLNGSADAGIRNQGSLNAVDNIFLISHTVENQGNITGTHVGLAAGTSVTLAQSGRERLTVLAGTAGTDAQTGVENSGAGQINALTAELKAAGGNIYALAINNAGAVRANTITHEGGHIYLRANGGRVANSGTLEARGEGARSQGGTVQVLGQEVNLAGSARIDVSGNRGGGVVLIGGDFHGGNSAIPNAQQTTVDAGAVIKADALQTGNGGKVVVWSDSSTHFSGSISAQGGAAQGQGGFAEVSSKGTLGYSGFADMRAPHGSIGNLLLDPLDAIVGTGPSGPTDVPGRDVIDAASISGSSANVLIQATRDLSFNAPVAIVNPAVSLTAEAGRNLTINSPVTTAGGSLSFTASAAPQAGFPSLNDPGATLAIHALVGDNSTGPISFINDGSGGILLNANIASSGNVNFNGPVFTLAPNLIVKGSGITFADTLDSAGGSPLILPRLDIINSGGVPVISWAVGYQGFKLQKSSDYVNWTDVPALNNLYKDTAPGFAVYRLVLDGTPLHGPAYQLNFGGSGSGLEFQGNASFARTVGGLGPFSLLQVDGTANLGTVLTPGNALTVNATTLDFKNNVTLGADATLNGTTVNFESTVNDTVANTHSLTVNADGSTTFGGAVGNTAALASLTTDAAGTTAINGGRINVNNQDYKDAVTIGNDTTLARDNANNPATSVNFENTLNGAHALNVFATATTLGGAVGGTAALTGLTTDAAGTTAINGGRINADNQDYKDAVTIGSDTMLAKNNANNSATSVNFENTLDGSHALSVFATATTFGAAVGGTSPLTSLTTDAAGTTAINGGRINADSQDYKDAVTIGNDTTVAKNNANNSASSVNFESTLDGAHALNVFATATTFGGVVGGATALTALTTDAAGTTAVNGGRINADNQDYKDAVTIGNDTTLAKNNANNSAASVNLESTVDGAHALNVFATATTFGGAVGGATALTSLTTDAAGTTAINGGRVNADNQDYKDAVTIGSDTTLARNNANSPATSVNFENTLNGAHALTAFAIATTFGGVVGGSTALTSLTTDASGSTAINGGRVNADNQDYKDAVTIGTDATLAKNSANNPAASVNFESTLDGAHALTVFAVATTFGGAVGGASPLTSLTTDAAGSTAINGGRVNADNQDYKDAVTIGSDTTVAKNSANNSAASVNFENTLDGAHALNVFATATTFGGVVGGATALTALTTDAAGTTAINGGRVNADNQDYKDAVTIGNDTTLAKNNANNSAASVNFENTLDGARALSVFAIATTFGGVVGGSSPLTSLTTDAAGTTAINGGRVNADNQDFKDAVTIGSDSIIAKNNANNPAASINFENTLDGAHALSVFAVATTFGGIVGGTAPLTSLTTDALGTTAVNGGRVNADLQDYKDAVTIGNDTTLAKNAANNPAASVNFETTLDGAHALNVFATATTFGGSVGGATPLTSLTTDAAGLTAINGGRVNADNQDYQDAVTIGNDTTLAKNNGNNPAASVNFETTLDGAHALSVFAAATTFGGLVGGTAPLTSLMTDAAGATAINGGRVNADNQDYKDAVTLGNDTILAKNNVNNPAASVNFESSLDGAHALNVFATATTFGGVVGGAAPLTSLTTDVAGTTAINGGRVNADNQDFKDAVTIGNDTTLAKNSANNPAASVNFEQTLNGTHALSVFATATTFGGVVGGTSPLASLTTDAAGTTAINGGRINADNQDYKDVVTIGSDTTLAKNSANNPATSVNFENTLNGAHALTVFAAATTFGGVVGGTSPLTSLTTDAAGTTAINGGRVNADNQDYKDAVTIGNDTTLAKNSANNPAASVNFESTLDGAHALSVFATATTFGGLVGGTTPLTSLTTDAAGATAINGGRVNADNQDYKDAVTIGSDTTLAKNSANNPAANVTFESTLDGAHALGVFAIATTFGGVVGGNAPLTSLTTDAAGVTAINGGRVSADIQDYQDAVTIGADTVLAGNSANNPATSVNFEQTLDGASALNVFATATTFGGAVGAASPLTSLTTDAAGTTAINGGRVNADDQDYKDAVTIGNDTTLAKNSANNPAANVNFESTLDGAHALSVFATTTTFGGVVGGSSPLTSLTTDAAGTTAINGGRVNADNQDYKDAVIIGNDTTLAKNSANNPAASVNFESTLDGAHALSVFATATTFGGVVGGTTPLTSLTTDSAGLTAINGGRVNANNQDYQDAVTIGTDTVLARNNANNPADTVNFAQTLDGARVLNIFATATTFGGIVGGAAPLTSLTTDAAGTTAINGGRINADNQDYKDAVTIGSDTTLAKNNANNAAASVNFENTLDGAHALSVFATATTFGGAVGGTSPLTSLTTDAAGTTAINGGRVNADNQDYQDAVTIGNDAILAKNSANNPAATVNFESTLDGAHALSVFATATTFGGVVGGTASLTSLTTDAAGTTAINGGRVNADNQDYKDAVTIGGDTVLARDSANNSAASVNFERTLDGAHALNVFATATTFGGVVGGLAPLTALTTDAAGTTAINGGRINANSQDYQDGVTLGADAVLAADNANNPAATVNFESTLDGPGGLSVFATETTFGGAVGGNTALASLTTDAAGTTHINGGSVLTSGGQTYNDAVLLGADTVLADNAGGDIIFESTLDGTFALAVNTLGNEEFNGLVGHLAPLASLVTDGDPAIGVGGHAIIRARGQLNGGSPSIRTIGTQTYNDNVQLGDDTVLATDTHGGITFNGGVEANGHSLALVFNFSLDPTSQLITDFSSENDRRILSTISPRVKKGQARESKGTGQGIDIPSLVPVERSFSKPETL